MKSTKLRKIIVSVGLFLVFGLFAVASVSAAGMWDSQVGSGGSNSIGSAFGGSPNPNIKVTIYNIINFSLSLLAIIFLVLTIIAGFIWMTAMGDAKKIETAKGYLTSAVIGLVIILASKGFTIFVLSKMLKITSGNNY
ncbi:MAG: hypothetical protein ACOYMB_03655 [Patescibacteria group bacterium]